MLEINARNLISAVLLQATKDYFDATDEEQKTIIKELCCFGDRGKMIAQHLQKHPKQIARRLRRELKCQDIQ